MFKFFSKKKSPRVDLTSTLYVRTLKSSNEFLRERNEFLEDENEALRIENEILNQDLSRRRHLARIAQERYKNKQKLQRK